MQLVWQNKFCLNKGEKRRAHFQLFYRRVSDHFVAYVYRNLHFSRLGGVSPAALGLTDLAVYTALAVVPLFVIWMTWNGFYRFRHEKNLQKQFKNIEAQFKQNQEFFEIVARMLWQGQQNRQNHFVLERTELFVSELNGLLADMLQRYNFISDSEAAKLWSTAEKGNKWGFAKALISLQNGSVDFENRLYRAAVRENLLRGTVNEFCARYARLLELLKCTIRKRYSFPSSKPARSAKRLPFWRRWPIACSKTSRRRRKRRTNRNCSPTRR